MAFLIRLVAVCFIATGASAQILKFLQGKLQQQSQPNPYLPQQQKPSSPADISSYLPLIQKYVPGASLTPPNPDHLTQQQLPRNGAPPPFYRPQQQQQQPPPPPSGILRPPPNYAPPNNNYHDIPVPSQELQVPKQLKWNPDNDPRYYYDHSKQERPTNLHPKKYDNQIHATIKPYLKAKEGGVYANGEQDAYKQKQIEKTRENLAKHENQKRLRAEKVLRRPRINKAGKNKNSKDQQQQGGKNEPQAAETGYLVGYDYDAVDPGYLGYAEGYAEGQSYAEGQGYAEGQDYYQQYGGGGGVSEGLNDELSEALHTEPQAPNERLTFQLHGHDGPNSYKWGFDHGEGQDRQFRFEERDRWGKVKGLYGYYDQHGKLQLVNYDAHPRGGFHVEGNFGKF